MDVIALRDHAEDILRVAARDMVSSQTAEQQADKSKGYGGGGTESAGLDRASNEHALARLGSGFDLLEVVSEYRALRASVLRLWGESVRTADEHDLHDVTRFNESMDQSLAEAVKSYTHRVDESRELFLATLGHDLRNPLNAIVVSSGLLARSGQLDDENTRIASQMSGFAKVMTEMIHDLLDFTRTRLGGGMPVSAAPVDLQELCRNVLDEFRAAYPHRPLRFESSGATSGEWDAARLRQVVSNLVANAVQYGADTTPVEVSARGDESDVLLVVGNEGTPIPRSALPTIFDPFVRAPEGASTHRRGVGLGLYIARQIVIAHGGTIAVTSDDTGTAFTVRLPRHRKTESDRRDA
ncbi:MAG: HAMP domain-containing histidine kinase [Acidobacteria bacterium]|nr:HAMP domain-containing histidine kinase [Acidobacteriota bacterium]MBV9477116.1 HAMP domain-containing histidine kinase [Acidobacteriota bacterium]